MKNIPNILSAFRLLLVPLFPIVFFSELPNARFWAAGIFLLAGATDVLDGYIARKYQWITPLGRMLDPLADKLMQTTALVTLTVAGSLPVWFCLLYLLKELFMGVGGLRLYKKISDVIPANRYGKIAVAFFYLVILAVIFFDTQLAAWKTPLLLLSLLLMAVAFIGYIQGYVKTLREIKK